MSESRPVEPLPDYIETERLVLRHWERSDAVALGAAVEESLDELAPWMPWTFAEPRSPRDREALFEQWQADWKAGGDTILGMFRGNRVIGSTGLHRRSSPSEVEIGYWVRTSETRRGYATEASRALTSAAFQIAGVHVVSIHHDRANQPSGGVPRKLGFTMVREVEYEGRSPGSSGVEWQWQVTKSEWADPWGAES